MGKRNGSRGEQTTKDVNLLSRISKSIKQVPSYIDYGATIKWIEIDDIWEQYSEENEMIKPYQAVLMDEKIYEQNVVLKVDISLLWIERSLTRCKYFHT